jgi:hypothetical protein
MGKTVESFRIALEGEIVRWSGFAMAFSEPDGILLYIFSRIGFYGKNCLIYSV